MTSKKTDTTHDTDPQLPAAKAVTVEPAVKSFATKIEQLMNEAYQRTQDELVDPVEKQKFADWCNHLGDLWREVKQHA